MVGVDHPSHYTFRGRECIDEMEERFGIEAVIHFCELNAYKYEYRAPMKGNPDQDLEKAEWYKRKAEECRARLLLTK